MRTSKPISTISYNTPQYLKLRLSELIKKKKICDWMFIMHTKEQDESKDHIHLWLKPNTLIDTMELQEFFCELDPKNPTKPLKCIDFRLGLIDDWILYNQHYKPYLASKMETRVFSYTKEDFVFYDEDTFEFNYLHAFKGSDWAHKNQILEQLYDGRMKPTDLILNGTVPLNMASQLNAFKYMQSTYGTDRGGRVGHSPNAVTTN